MRISTQTMNSMAVNAMLDQQASLAKLQNQVASGKKVSTPADDPVAAVHILELERTQSESDQFGKNANIVQSRLNQEEQAMTDTGTIMQRVRELAVQAGNTATLSDSDRQSIATEIQARRQELVDIANRKDSNGEFLFAGFSTLTQPFANDAVGSVNYAGDRGARVIQVGPTQKIADSDSGYDVFMNLQQGNGTFVTGAASTNTGSGMIDLGTMVNRSAWVPGTYTLNFTTPTDWQVVDGATPSNVVASGTYTAGSAIAFNGVQVSVTGTPAAGDSFTVSPAGKQDIFTTLDNMVAALQKPSTGSAGSAQLAMSVAQSLQQLDQANDHFLSVRATVGSRLNTLDDASTARDNLNIDLQSSLSDLRDLDYAKALTQMTQQVVGLQAAQQSYSKISQLSLFNYL